MNKHQAALFSFLSKAASGEAEMPPHVLDEFGELAKQALKKQFSKREEGFRLRMSNVGRPLCQLQMEATNTEAEAPDYDFKMRMIIGDVLEAVVIALLKGAGVEVKNKHKKVSLKVNDSEIQGEYDIELDDGIYDIKTASPYAFETKFNADDAFDKIHDTDSFGYVTQGYGYGLASDKPFKGWIAVNKSTGQIAVAEAPSNNTYKENAKNEIQNVHKAISDGRPFKRCFTDTEEFYYKKSTGNRTLGIECSYCPFKSKCWDNLEFRRQLPSKGRNPRFVWYTHITKEWRDTINKEEG